MEVVSRRIGESEFIIPKGDPNYEKNMIKIRVEDLTDGSVRLSLECNLYAAKKGDSTIEKEVALKRDETIEFVHLTDKEGKIVEITNIAVIEDKVKLGIDVDSEKYITHREEIYEAIIRERRREQF